MFGNLKNKLGEVADLKKYASPQLVTSLSSSRQRSAQHTPGIQSPRGSHHSRQLSNASQDGLVHPTNGTDAPNRPPNIQEVPSSNSQPQQNVSRLKEEFAEKLLAKDREWSEKYNREHEQVLELQKQVQQLESREADLEKKLSEGQESKSSTENEEMEKRLEVLQDDYDQLEGLNNQEVAKVKHLLLNASKEIESKNELLVKATNSLQEARAQLSLLSDQSERIAGFAEEKMEFETTIAGLKQKLNSTNLKMSLQEKEKLEIIKNLQEKVNTLLARQQHEGLEENDKIKSLIEERESLENRLEEKRQEVNNIKLSWSEKISQLETQIGNLNEKILDDQGELNRNENLIEELHCELAQVRLENASLVKENKEAFKDNEGKVNQLNEDIETAKWQLQELETQKDQDIKELRKQLHIKEEHLTQVKESLSLAQDREKSNSDKYAETLVELDTLRQKFDQLKVDHENLEVSHRNFSESFDAQRKDKDQLLSDLTAQSAKLDVVLSEKAKLSNNLDTYVEKVSQLEVQVAYEKEENELIKANTKQLEDQLIEIRNRHDELTQKMKDSEKFFEEKVKESASYKQLEFQVATFEEELSEKKQVIKMQGQRLSDMKKTIQRELKINTSMDNESQRATIVPSSADQPSQISPRDNGEVFDPINLSYLRHVLVKFMTSREYEAIQLTRAIAALLHLNEEEEKLIRETLNYKMSWFGSRPNVGKGQLAKAIPPKQ